MLLLWFAVSRCESHSRGPWEAFLTLWLRSRTSLELFSRGSRFPGALPVNHRRRCRFSRRRGASEAALTAAPSACWGRSRPCSRCQCLAQVEGPLEDLGPRGRSSALPLSLAQFSRRKLCLRVTSMGLCTLHCLLSEFPLSGDQVQGLWCHKTSHCTPVWSAGGSLAHCPVERTWWAFLC